MSLIKTCDLTKTYEMGSSAVHALRGVSLQIEAGEFVALMGTSGSGKSTLMHLLGCLDTPTAGQYYLADDDVSTLSTGRRAQIRNERIGFIFQTFNLLARMSTLDNVALPLLYRGHGRQVREQAAEALTRVGLADRLDHRPSELSGGQRQRVAIARALVADPAIILADEPTGNLDSVTGAEIMNLLTELSTEGRTILMVTHDHHIAGYANKILQMKDGLIVQTNQSSD
jgi:putative ABC transport system ATP-binding protein